MKINRSITQSLFCSLACLIITLLSCSLHAQDGGVFLKLPLSPRAGGMGDASAALGADPFGLYYNPAGMAYVKSPAVSFVYHQYLQDISGNSFAFVYPFKNFTLGVAPTVFKMKEEPIYNSLGVDTGDKLGYGSKIIPIALAGRIGSLAVGVAGKSYSESIAGQASATTAYDAGAIYKFGSLSFGAAIQNLGGKIFGYDVAKVRRAGVAYNNSQYSVAADLKKEGEDKSSLGFGGSFTLDGVLKLRGGWRVKDEFGGMTFGLGLKDLKEVLKGGKNADFLILLSHAGLDENKKIAADFGQIDLIIAGHSQELLKRPVKAGNALIVQSGGNLENLGRIVLRFGGGKLLNHSYDVFPLTNDIPDSPRVLALIKEA